MVRSRSIHQHDVHNIRPIKRRFEREFLHILFISYLNLSFLFSRNSFILYQKSSTMLSKFHQTTTFHLKSFINATVENWQRNSLAIQEIFNVCSTLISKIIFTLLKAAQFLRDLRMSSSAVDSEELASRKIGSRCLAQ